MANKKITELDAITTLASTDVVPVVDVSADTTNKITTTNLFRTLPDGTAAAPSLSFASDAANGIYLASSDTVGISTGGTQRVTVDGSGNVTISGDLTVSGATTTVESTTVTIDDKNIELGSVASPSNTTADGGGITLKGATDKTIKWINSTGFWTFNTGVEIDGNLQMDDGKKIRLGTGQDLQIYHDATDSYIDNTQGDLYLRTTGSGDDIVIKAADDVIIQSQSSEAAVICRGDGQVELYHDATKKLETKSDGIDVVGEVQCDSLDVDGAVDIDGGQIYYDAANNNLHFIDNVKARFGTGSDLRIYHDGSNSYIDDAGTGNLQIRGSSQVKIQKYTGENMFVGIADGAASMYYDNSQKIATKSDGIDVTGEVQCDSLDVDGAADITGNVTLHANLDLQDNDRLNIGSSDDFTIRHNGTDTHIENDTGTLFISQHQDNEDIAIRTDDGSGAVTNYILCDGSEGNVRLYHYGTQKLGTKSDGIDVTGEVQCDSLDVDGNADITGHIKLGANGRIGVAGSTATPETAVKFVDSDNINFIVGNSEKARIDNSGNLAVGSTSPQARLEVRQDSSTAYDSSDDDAQKSGTSSICITNHNGSNNSFSQLVFDTAGSNQSIARIAAIRTGSGSNDLAFVVEGSNTKREAMRIDSSGNVIVGTSSTVNPTLRILGSSAQNSFIQFADGDSNNVGQLQYSHSSNALITAVNGSERMRIDSSGHLLLGTTTEGDSTADNLTIADSGDCGMTVRSGTSSSGSIFFSDATSGSGEYDGYVQYQHNNRALRFATAATERFRIDSSGRVGIGDSNPDVAFSIKGSGGPVGRIQATDQTNARLRIQAGNTSESFLEFGDSDDDDVGEIVYGHSTNHMRFRTNGSEQMRLDSSGRLLLGTTTEGQISADNFTVADSGHCGITIRSGTTSEGAIYFSDGTSGDAEYRGYFLYDHDGDHLRIGTAAVERLRILSTGAWSIEGANNYGTSGQVLTSNGNDSPTWQDAGAGSVGGANAISMNDNVKINFGASNDLQIYHDGTNSYIDDAGTGNLRLNGNEVHILSNDNSEYSGRFISNGAVELYHNGNKKFETKSDGVDITGELQCDTLDVDGAMDVTGTATFHNNIHLQDSDHIYIGTGFDIDIYHNGTNSIIDNNTGDLYIQTTGSGDDVIIEAVDDIFIKPQGGESGIEVIGNGAVKLAYDNAFKLETRGAGVQINGDLGIGGVSPGNSFDNGAALALGDNDTGIRQNGDGILEVWSNNAQMFRFRNGGNSNQSYNHLNPSGNNSLDLGTSSLRWRNVYTNDLNLSNEGSGNDVDGTWGNYTIQEGEDDLFLINRRNGKKYKFNLTEVS